MDSHRDVEEQGRTGATPDPGDGIAVVIHQPHAWRGLTPVDVPWGRLVTNQVLLDAQGQHVPFQVVPPTEGRGSRIVFVARVAEDGRARYRMVNRSPQASPYREVFASETELDNMDLRLELDPRTGTPASLVDRRTCDELLGGPGWAGGSLSPTSGDGDFIFHAVHTTCTERGPVRSTLRSESCLRGCRLVQEFRLYRDLPWVDVTATVVWDAPRDLLSLGFVTDLDSTDDTVHAHSSRDDTPSPGWRWVDLSLPAHLGLSLLHGMGASAQVCGNALRLEARRHPPGTPTSTLRYALLPHAGDRLQAGLAEAAALLDSDATLEEGPAL